MLHIEESQTSVLYWAFPLLILTARMFQVTLSGFIPLHQFILFCFGFFICNIAGKGSSRDVAEVFGTDSSSFTTAV